MKYVALLRGINVGGNKKVSMAELKLGFESVGHTEVKTYINSGNVIFVSSRSDIAKLQKELEAKIEALFGFAVQVLVISSTTLNTIVENKPKGFGDEPEKYHSDVAFLLQGMGNEAVLEFQPNPEVDAVWAGEAVIYYRRLSEKLTKSRISKIITKPIYKQMTIRSWNTVAKLSKLIEA